MLARFQVDKGGRARQLEMIEADPPDRKSLGSKLRKRIRATKFRPRFDQGQPVETGDVYYRYKYYY